MQPPIEEITYKDKMMARLADINRIAFQETVHELKEPGSGIGKFGDYPVGAILVNARNRDNIRPSAQDPPPNDSNLDSPRTMKGKMNSLEDEIRSLKSQLAESEELRSIIVRAASDIEKTL